MVKILHIGGVNSPHVLGIMEQIKKYTTFKQAVISYPTTIRDFDKHYFKNVPVYYYNYPLFFTKKAVNPLEEKRLARFIKRVIAKEKPDIIHGHYLSKCAVALYYAINISGKPGIVVPWSTWDIATNKHMFTRIKRCLNSCSYVMCNHTKFLNSLLDTYKQPRSKGLFSFPPIRLYAYTNVFPKTDRPRLLIVRGHYQEPFFKALPNVLSKFPNLEITASPINKLIKLAKKFGVYNNVTFLKKVLPQSQEYFIKLIQRHNIVRSMAPDHGTSSTTLQSAYFGAVVLSNKCKWSYLKDRVNLLTCDLTAKDIEKQLLFAIRNLPSLCTTFRKNNAFLAKWDAEITWKNLFVVYKKMLNR